MKLKQKNKINYLPLAIVSLLFVISSSMPIKAQWAIMYRDADSLILAGADYIYNLEFEKAEALFKDVQRKYPIHPAGYFLDAMIEWWKISINLEDYSNDELFKKKIDKVIQISNKILDTNNFDINALFFKGGAIGYRARFYTMRDEWFLSAQDGKEAYDILQKCQQLAPFNHDIMLGTGLYNYLSQKLPEEYPIIKPLMYFLPNGDARLGLFQLRAAARHARYASVEAKVSLLQIYYTFENNNYEALQIAQELSTKYPQNTYFLRYLGRCQVRLGMTQDYEKTWRDVLNGYVKKAPGYNAITAREATYYIGVALMNQLNWSESAKYFKKSLEGSRKIDKKPSGFQIYTLLKLGNCYDALNNRNEAKKCYNQVLDIPEWNDSHKTAKKYLQSAYKP
jgi:hypothetical protein